MRSDAQRKAQNKYDKIHYSVLTAKVKSEDAAAFQEYAASNNTTVNALLSGFILDCISSDPSGTLSNSPATPGAGNDLKITPGINSDLE